MEPSQLGSCRLCPNAAASAPCWLPLNGDTSWKRGAFSGNGGGGMPLVICTWLMFFCSATLTASAMRAGPCACHLRRRPDDDLV